MIYFLFIYAGIIVWIMFLPNPIIKWVDKWACDKENPRE
jgi:hypothetical protein